MIKQIGILTTLIVVSGCNDSSTIVYRDIYHDIDESPIAGASSIAGNSSSISLASQAGSPFGTGGNSSTGGVEINTPIVGQAGSPPGTGGATSTTTSINTGGAPINSCPMLGTTPTTCFKDIMEFPTVLDVCVPATNSSQGDSSFTYSTNFCGFDTCSDGTIGCRLQITLSKIDWELYYDGVIPLPFIRGNSIVEKVVGEIRHRYVFNGVSADCVFTFAPDTTNNLSFQINGGFKYNTYNKSIFELSTVQQAVTNIFVKTTLVDDGNGACSGTKGTIVSYDAIPYTQVNEAIKKAFESQNNLQCAECDSSCAQNIACVNKS